VGAAGVFPVTLSALVDAYPAERRAYAVAVWSGVSAAGAVAGTIVAGLLLEVFWWASVQLVFGVVALLLCLPAARLVAQHRNPGLSLDPWGAGWAVLALGGLVYGFAVLGYGLAGEVAAEWWPLALGLALFGLGFGLGVTPGTVLILEGLPPERPSVASAVNDITREVGGVLGIAVLSSVLIARYRDAIAATASTFPPAVQESITASAGAGLGVAAASGPAGAVLADSVRLAFAEGVAGACGWAPPPWP